MKAQDVPHEVIHNLRYLVKKYDVLTKGMVQITNSLHATNPDLKPKFDETLHGDKKTNGMEQLKNQVSRKIEKELVFWDLWTKWLGSLKGVGPWEAGTLILLLHYRFVPICKDCGGDLTQTEEGYRCEVCGKEAKADGVLKYRLELRRYPKISSLWHHFGLHVGRDGKVPKRKKGYDISDPDYRYSTKGRTLFYHISRGLMTASPLYKAVYDEKRQRYQQVTHGDDWLLGHIHNAAKHDMVKLFASHLLIVAAEIEGWDLPLPYANDPKLMGHSGYIAPFYWNSTKKGNNGGGHGNDTTENR
jgi:hypothetical protein